MFDGFFYKFPRLRKTLSILIPDKPRTIELLHRKLLISTRFEIGLLRLSWLINSSPTGHEIASLFSLAGFLREGYTFVDVGANVGLYAVPMATIGEIVGFKVVAIEPNPRTVRVLRRNLQGYHCATVIEGAASNRGGEITMGSSGIASGTFRVQKTNKREEILPDDEVVPHIKCFRLDQLDFENTNLVFKIDVEGHETEVLESMNGLLTKNQVKAVMIDGFDDKSIPCKLISFGFKLFDGRSLCPFNNRDHFNLLAVHESEVRKNQGVLE